MQEEFGNWQKTAIGIQFNSIISLDEIEKQTPLAWITRPKCQRHKGQSQVGSKGPSGLQMFGSGLIIIVHIVFFSDTPPSHKKCIFLSTPSGALVFILV